jgi:hypothetical protein
MATTTIQRSFVKTLMSSKLSNAKKYKAVANFLKQKPEVESVPGLKVEYYSFCIDTDSVNKVRNYLHASKTTDYKGRIKYEIEEEYQLLF